MSGSEPSHSPPRWPGVVGTLGIVLGVVMFVDKTDDLALIPLMWSGYGMSELLGPEAADFLERSMPTRWLLFSCLTGMALGLFLVVASIRLRQHRRSGIHLCRLWSWLAIGWLVVNLAWIGAWLVRHSEEIPHISSLGWEWQSASFLFLVSAALLIYPLFLLFWLSRATVRQQVTDWPE